MIRRLLGVALLTGAITGCTTIQLEPLPEGMTNQPPADWAERSNHLSRFDQWQLRGKLAVKQPSDSGTAIINGWRQQGERYDLSLSSSFLGMGTTRLTGVPGFIELTLANGETYQSSDPETLVAGGVKLLEDLRAQPALEGRQVLAPGDREWRCQARRDAEGIPLDTANLAAYRQLAETLELAPPMLV